MTENTRTNGTTNTSERAEDYRSSEGLRALLDAFLDFREEVVVRRVKFELAKARDRGHVLVGLAVAVANIDEVIHIIRSSADPSEARERLQDRAWPVGDMMALVAGTVGWVVFSFFLHLPLIGVKPW